jgi:hypothetical protein
MALPLPLRVMPFGFFFGFDFLAEFFIFGVFGFAAFAFVFVVDFFDLHRFAFALVVGFACFCFFFVVFLSNEERPCRGRGQGSRMSRGGGGEQQQRGEQEDQQDREFSHGSLIGAWGGAV